jgi:hypothetical protein
LEAGAEGLRLSGETVAACWDPELSAAMAEAGVAVEEEAVLEDLLADLGSAPMAPPMLQCRS